MSSNLAAPTSKFKPLGAFRLAGRTPNVDQMPTKKQTMMNGLFFRILLLVLSAFFLLEFDDFSIDLVFLLLQDADRLVSKLLYRVQGARLLSDLVHHFHTAMS